MKTLKQLFLAAGLAAGLAAPAVAAVAAPSTGDTVRHTAQVVDFAQTGAESWSDLQGRAVLVEFFAYW